MHESKGFSHLFPGFCSLHFSVFSSLSLFKQLSKRPITGERLFILAQPNGRRLKICFLFYPGRFCIFCCCFKIFITRCR